MLNHGYLARTLRRPLPTKDGGTLRTVADAVRYIRTPACAWNEHLDTIAV
jgi:hypothetical protein